MREEGVRGLLRDSVAQERGRGRSRSGSASRCRRRRALPLQRGAWRGGEEEDSGRAGLGRPEGGGLRPEREVSFSVSFSIFFSDICSV